MEAIPPILGATAACLLFILLHWILWNFHHQGVSLLGKLAVISYTIVAGVILLSFHFPVVRFLFVSLPLFAFFVIAYVRLYISVTRTLSVRILQELSDASGSLTFQQLDERYPRKQMFLSRIVLLNKHGWIRDCDGTLKSTRKGNFVGSLIISLRQLYRLRNAG